MILVFHYVASCFNFSFLCYVNKALMDPFHCQKFVNMNLPSPIDCNFFLLRVGVISKPFGMWAVSRMYQL